MKRLIILLLVISALTSCDDQAKFQEISILDFSIDIPADWALEEVQGYDTYLRKIIINEREVIDVELGLFSSDLSVDNATHGITNKVIDNRKAKIVRPKNFQSGITGVYFDSTDNTKTKLVMSGVDLIKANKWLFLQAIETIKFN